MLSTDDLDLNTAGPRSLALHKSRLVKTEALAQRKEYLVVDGRREELLVSVVLCRLVASAISLRS